MSSKALILLVVTPLFVALDQVTKVLVRVHIPRGDRVGVIPDVVDLIHVENPGAAWGLMNEHEHRLVIFYAVSVVAFIVIGMYYRSLRHDENLLAVALSLILAGAIGNFVDRVLFHQVTDFVDIYIGWNGQLRSWLLDHTGTSHYPTFNVADVAIVAGVAVFLIHALILDPLRAQRAEAAAAADIADTADAEEDAG